MARGPGTREPAADCNPSELRLRCLQLAVGSVPNNVDEALRRAHLYVGFVTAAEPADKPEGALPASP